jgi:hypothetical protein
MPAWRWGGRLETALEHVPTAPHLPRALTLKRQHALLPDQIILLC